MQPPDTFSGEGILASYKAGSPNLHVGLEHPCNLWNVRDLVKDEMFKVFKDPSNGEVKKQVHAKSCKDEWGVADSYVCPVACLRVAFVFRDKRPEDHYECALFRPNFLGRLSRCAFVFEPTTLLLHVVLASSLPVAVHYCPCYLIATESTALDG